MIEFIFKNQLLVLSIMRYGLCFALFFMGIVGIWESSTLQKQPPDQVEDFDDVVFYDDTYVDWKYVGYASCYILAGIVLLMIQIGQPISLFTL